MRPYLTALGKASDVPHAAQRRTVSIIAGCRLPWWYQRAWSAWRQAEPVLSRFRASAKALHAELETQTFGDSIRRFQMYLGPDN